MTTQPSTPTTYRALPDLIGDRIVEVLTLYCVTSLADDDASQPYMAEVVRRGLFQANPVKARIAILVNPSDPSDLSNEPKRSDKITSVEVREPFVVLAFEIGGGERRWVHFTIEVRVYLSTTQENREDARHIGLWVFGRVQQAIRENKSLGLVDDFGERALFMFVEKVNKYEGGGPPKSHTWEGQVFVTALTETDETA